MRIYLSGPMRGYPSFNFPFFDKVGAALQRQGYRVSNPAAHDRLIYPDIESWPGFETGDPEQCPQFNLPNSLIWDFQAILDVDGIAMLPGWERSNGARAERFVAEAVGKQTWLVAETLDDFALVHDSRDAMMAFPQIKEAWL